MNTYTIREFWKRAIFEPLSKPLAKMTPPALLLLLALALLLPAGARAKAAGAIHTDSTESKPGEAVFALIKTEDGGYATIGAGSDDSHICLRKYSAGSGQEFATEMVCSYFGIGNTISNYPLIQTTDGGYAVGITNLVNSEGYNSSIYGVCRLDKNGNFLWSHGLDRYYVSALAALPDGGVLVATGDSLYKLDASGRQLWEKKPFDLPAGDKDRSTITAMCTLSDGRIMAAGEHYFHPDEYSQYTHNCIAIYDADGNITWMEKTPGWHMPGDSSNIDYIMKQIFIALPTNDGGCILSGTNEGRTYLEKRNADGKLAWSYANPKSALYSMVLSMAETDEGYFCLGQDGSGIVGNRTYTNTILLRFTKDGRLLDKTTMFEGLDQSAGIIQLGDGFLIAGGKLEANNGQSGTFIRISIRDGEQHNSGWHREGSPARWRFYENGHKQRGWVHDGSGWYLLGYEGEMLTGWAKADNSWYHLQPNGRMTTGWLKDGDAWYYLNPSGEMAVNPVWDNNQLYLIQADGRLFAGGWKEFLPNSWYYTYPSGRMALGWVQLGSRWHYFDTQTGMWANYTYGQGWVETDAGWSFVGWNSSEKLTGWELINGSWYYLKGGIMQTGWQKVGSTWYHLKDSGAMTRGWLKTEQGGSTRWYYLRGSGAMVAGEYTIGKAKHLFDKNGVWLRQL